MSLAGQNNDIIIVGDSSGLNGLLANNIYNSTGLKTVVIYLYMLIMELNHMKYY